jgi:hypothetical protein
LITGGGGGREQLAAFYNEKPEDFYRTDSKTYKAYLDVIRQVITRTNTVTGRAYSDEKAIMAWETGNELEDTNAAFLKETAAWIRKWAPHQLIVDGTYKKINDFALTDPNVDIVSNHYYTNADNNHPTRCVKTCSHWWQEGLSGGEFGLLDHTQLNDIMQSIVHSEVNGAQAVGGFIWGFAAIAMTAGSTGIKSIPVITAITCQASRSMESNRKWKLWIW